jgi:hypothetical protein
VLAQEIAANLRTTLVHIDVVGDELLAATSSEESN